MNKEKVALTEAQREIAKLELQLGAIKADKSVLMNQVSRSFTST